MKYYEKIKAKRERKQVIYTQGGSHPKPRQA